METSNYIAIAEIIVSFMGILVGAAIVAKSWSVTSRLNRELEREKIKLENRRIALMAIADFAFLSHQDLRKTENAIMFMEKMRDVNAKIQLDGWPDEIDLFQKVVRAYNQNVESKTEMSAKTYREAGDSFLQLLMFRYRKEFGNEGEYK